MKHWLATTWEGSIFKIAGGAALGALLSWLATADVHPLIVALGAAVIPVIINALNGEDDRYGRFDNGETM
jgi:CDP-diglyceride synthetase